MGTLIDALTGIGSPWLYLLIAALAAAESAALVGLVVPGEAALLVGGYAASQGRVSLPVMIGVVVVAAIVGDSIGYGLGRHFGPRVQTTRVGRWVGDERWTKAERFIDRRGGPAVLLGRWVGLLRALVPGVAGMTRMPYPRFLVWNVVGAAVWAPAVVVGGYLAGDSFRAVERWLGRASLILLVVAGFGFLLWLAARWAVEHRSRVVAVLGNVRSSVVVRRAESTVRPFTDPVVERFRPHLAFAVIVAVAMVVVGAMGWALAETFESVAGASGIARLDQPVADWFAGHQTGWLTRTMDVVSMLGGGTGAVVVTAAVAVIGRVRGAWRPAVVMAAALGGAVALSQAIKYLTARTRPTGAVQVFDGFAFPSGHTTAAVAVAGAAAWLLMRARPWRTQVAIGAVAVFVGGMVGFSRAYLGAHWVTDVVGGWLLGTAWLTTVIATDLLVARRAGPGRAASSAVPNSVEQRPERAVREEWSRPVSAVAAGTGLLAVVALGSMLFAARFEHAPAWVFLGTWMAGAVMAGWTVRSLSPSPVARAAPVAAVGLFAWWLGAQGVSLGLEVTATAVAGLSIYVAAAAIPADNQATSVHPRRRRVPVIAAVAMSLSLVSAVPSGAWIAGVRQKTPTQAQANTGGIDTVRSTHQWLASQGVVILGNDGRDAVASFLASPDPTAPEATDPATGAGLGSPNTYEWRLLKGVDDADGVLYPQIRDHLHNHWTHRGRKYVVGASAASNAEKAFAEAERLWAAGDKGNAVYWLGASLHLVQDSCVPQHGWFGIGVYHHDYEAWVRSNQDALAVTSGGIYQPDFRVGGGHGGDDWSSSNPRGWADECAHRAFDNTAAASHPLPAQQKPTDLQWGTAPHVADTQGISAGYIAFFFDTVGGP